MNGEQVGSILIKMGAEGMAEGMAGETVFPTKFGFFGRNELVYRIRCHGACRVTAVGKQESLWPAEMEPILCQDIESVLREDGVAVRTCFGMTDMYAHGSSADILVAESADFSNPKPGRIQERENCLVLKVGKRLNKIPDFFLRRNKRKVRIKFPHREL